MDKGLNELFAAALLDVRRNFHGSVTYASGEWEEIDWSVFDIVSIDLYRAQHNEAIYQQQLSTYIEYQKPVAITEFGCCALKGAASLGGAAMFAVLSAQDGGLVVNEGWQYKKMSKWAIYKNCYKPSKKPVFWSHFGSRLPTTKNHIAMTQSIISIWLPTVLCKCAPKKARLTPI
ncbi:hypothetical protein [Ktedonospora formicarum]|uniref:hypothetical protein n=1 Tax=Ktedonospora formicarum TaxID=2778364 RepID=UPI001C688764|nr:hypothetical protein [Ktedonospora formicarum]